MKSLFKFGSAVLTLAFMTACGNDVVSNGTSLNTTATLASDKQSVDGVKGKRGGDKAGFQDFLNLTDEQKTQLQTLRDSLFPKPDSSVSDDTRKANMDAVKTAFKDAFLADSIDVSALKSKLESLKPATVDSDSRLKAQAEYMIKSYAILTAEQKATLETKQAEMEANKSTADSNRPDKVRPSADPNFNPATKMIDNLASKLTLTDEQKTKLTAVFEANKPSQPDTATIDANRATMEANRKSIQASIKDGSATVDSIVALLKAGRPDVKVDNTDNRLNTLVQIHDILTAEQRKIAVDLPMIGFGVGGDKGHGGGHGDMKGGKGGFGAPF